MKAMQPILFPHWVHKSSGCYTRTFTRIVRTPHGIIRKEVRTLDIYAIEWRDGKW